VSTVLPATVAELPEDNHDGSYRFRGEGENEAMVYQALVCGLKDYVNKNGFNVPFTYTSELSKTAAQEQAERLGVKYESVSIEPMYQAFVNQLEPIFKGLEKNTTEENIQARCRGLLLMAYSNKMGNMVLTTGNKSWQWVMRRFTVIW